MVCGEADARVIADGVVSGLGPAVGGTAPSFDGFDERSPGPAGLGNEFRSALCVQRASKKCPECAEIWKFETATSAMAALHLQPQQSSPAHRRMMVEDCGRAA